MQLLLAKNLHLVTYKAVPAKYISITIPVLKILLNMSGFSVEEIFKNTPTKIPLINNLLFEYSGKVKSARK